jgi:hypothetical protein
VVVPAWCFPLMWRDKHHTSGKHQAVTTTRCRQRLYAPLLWSIWIHQFPRHAHGSNHIVITLLFLDARAPIPGWGSGRGLLTFQMARQPSSVCWWLRVVCLLLGVPREVR